MSTAHRMVDRPKGLTAAFLEEATVRGLNVDLTVRGSSMLNLLRSGDLTQLRPGGNGSIRLGDVVAVRSSSDESRMVVHRVVARQGEEVLVRGDNCPRADGRFALADVIGVVTRVERKGRSVWFGSGRLGRVVAWAVRTGLVWRFNRLYYGSRRVVGRVLKFRRADSRLPGQKGDDGDE